MFSYTAQLVSQTRSLLAIEAWPSSKIFRWPGACLSADAAFELQHLGCARMRSPAAACFGALARTSLSGKIDWASSLASCTAQAEIRLPWRRSLLGDHHSLVGTPLPNFWQSGSLAATLRLASLGQGLFTNKMLALAAAAAVVKGTRLLQLAEGQFLNGLQAGMVQRFEEVAYKRVVAALVAERWTKMLGFPDRVSEEEFKLQCWQHRLVAGTVRR